MMEHSQNDHRYCAKCARETHLLVQVLVFTGYVLDCENTVPEWTKQWWCFTCLRASL